MDFELTDEQAMLREASRSMLADRTTIDRTHVDRGDDPYDEALWQLGCELGWTGLAVPDRFGGTGQGLAELVLVAEELGRAAAPNPFVPTTLTSRALARGGNAAAQAALLPGLAEGTVASVALDEPGRTGRPQDIGTTAQLVDGAYRVTGRKCAVQHARQAWWVLVSAVLGDRLALLLVDLEDPRVRVRRQEVLDLTRSFHEVTFDDVVVPADRLIDDDPAAVQLLTDDAAVLTAADALGAMEQMLSLTVGHVTTRHQFDRPIGSFQAVKQATATMAIDVHATRAAVHYAAMAIDADAPDATRAAAAAASFAGTAATRVAGWALQLHGGIGFTWEHDLHLYLRRATVDAALHGGAAVHDDRLVGLLQTT
ncbi:alkylation response protein AidB-like acyl-CoA dehydrogenase [Prauserella sediminis]|uniref:Alkylation response protein AidB-like acyl-CoA dehydrogenase n=1 Tax=Prauserella sediminis TaxID=577680 RepID=A0A839XU89_9PSEU|nr:acyl-CoA dehydrogenase family protein [Prauserella sediminis]MBB3665599.1 alkylation response protein AidB-like acyl-CoA dehydrogenase [Prauserella sediminis]